MREISRGEIYTQALKEIILWNNTVMQWTESMSGDMKKQMPTRFKCTPKLPLQFD